MDGTYHDLPPNPQGWLWSEQLGLFWGIHNEQLGYFSADGELIPTPEESAAATAAIAETERQPKEKLAAKLRELGVDPGAIA